MREHINSLIPMPHEIKCDGGRVLIAKGAKSLYRISADFCTDPVYQTAVEMLEKRLFEQGGLENGDGSFEISLKISKNEFGDDVVSDSYTLDITDDGAYLTGFDAGGVYYAAVTLLKLIEKENDRTYLPKLHIVDKPDFKTRGLFIEDRYGSDFLTKENWFDAIDYFADMKFNSITVGVYGCWCIQYDKRISEFLYVPIEKYPQLTTLRNVKYYSVADRRWVYKKDVLPKMFEDDYLGELIAYAKKRNIKVKPLFNSYGHNTLLPRVFPELSAKDENGDPTGFGVCTNDERTFDIMFDIYDEIIDKYLAPNGIDAIQIGLDEVRNEIGTDTNDPFRIRSPFCKCEKCRSTPRSELMVDYITKICLHLKEKGIKHVYVYHDMLFNEFDVLKEELVRKWKDAGVYDMIVIDWWDYANGGVLFSGKETNSLFRSIYKPITGYYHWSMPLEYLNNIKDIAILAQEKNAEGIEAYSSIEYCHDRSYQYLADLCWNMENAEKPENFLERYAYQSFPDNKAEAADALEIMRELLSDGYFDGEDKAFSLFRLEYYMYTYTRQNKSYPRRFPEEVAETVLGQLNEYVAFFEKVSKKAGEALAIFEAMPVSDIARIWIAIAMQYKVVADEYLGLIKISSVNDADTACHILEKLIADREKLMYTVETTRIKANSYQCLRNMSIYRQILLDIYDHAVKCRAEGIPFDIDMRDLSSIKGDMLAFLR